MINVICFTCEQPLREKGAILISRPNDDHEITDTVLKRHLCNDCMKNGLWELICKFRADMLESVK